MSAWTVSAVTPGIGVCTITSAATTLVTGNQAILYGIAGISSDVNDMWTVTVLSPTSTRLNGCTATGSYSGGGTLSSSSENFLMMSPIVDFDYSGISPGDSFQVYIFERGIIRVPPCSNIRQIRIDYLVSGQAPLTTTASVGIDDSLEFFKYRVASMVGVSKGYIERAKMYENRAGVILADMLANGVRNLQRLPPAFRRSLPWRVHRRRSVF